MKNDLTFICFCFEVEKSYSFWLKKHTYLTRALLELINLPLENTLFK